MKKVIFGDHDNNTLKQFENTLAHGNVAGGVLCADGHYGYSQPVGGVVAYENQISPSGVGCDIACGNKAIKTNLKFNDIKNNLPQIMDEIQKAVPFGVGKKLNQHKNHEVFEDPLWDVFLKIRIIDYDLLMWPALSQLGAGGAGKPYVDVLVDEKHDDVWLGTGFSRRAFGHQKGTGFMNLANNRRFPDSPPRDSMDAN